MPESNIEYRGDAQKKHSNKKQKLDFKKLKKNVLKSINEVEYFLHDFKRFSDYIKLYKILK